jgi:DNA-binding response OmpR family regulator
MYIIVDDRADVTGAYTGSFRSEGVVSLGFHSHEFRDWFRAVSDSDAEAVQSFLLGDFEGRAACPEIIRNRTRAPIIALADLRSLDTTLDLFTAGVDDVVRKPVHVREIMARAGAIWRRINDMRPCGAGRLSVYFDGRDPEIDGEPLALPRRERRILEFLVKNAHRRVTKTQIFNAVYGLFEESVDEIVVEGHVSKLRKKLRLQLGYDVIDAKRYLGYQFVANRFGSEQPVAATAFAPIPAMIPVPVRHEPAAFA